jgi:hypothetical protein
VIERLPRASWRLLVATAALTGFAHEFVAGVDVAGTWMFVQHVVVPVLVLADVAWQPGVAGRWWWPLSWVLLPAGYLAYHQAAELVVYDALDPFSPD